GTTADWPVRFRELTTALRGLGARARALPDAAVWAEVAQATLETHRRDLDALAPWIEGLEDLRRARLADRGATSAVNRLLAAPPPLCELPDLARAAAREIAQWMEGRGSQDSGLLDRGRAAATVEALASAAPGAGDLREGPGRAA